MFTRRKHNRSGTISVVVVDKSGGSFKEIHRMGVAHSEEEAAGLEAEARHWIATYGGQLLWNVERAFRITKGTLEVRPMFHFSEKRIEAHVCICFVALKVYKELERLLKVSGCPYFIDNVLRIAEVIVTLDIDLTENGKTLTKTIYTSKEERDIAYLIETNDWLNKNG